MNFSYLNPLVRSVSLYERVTKSDVCVAYDARVIYVISGELTYTASTDSEKNAKKTRLSPGNFLYIPAGCAYSLKSKHVRFVVVSFDLCANGKYTSEIISPVAKEDFKPELAHTDDIFPPFDKVITIEDLEAERDTFIRMSNIFTSAEGLYLSELSAMLKLVLLKVANLTDESALPASMVENLDGYIRENVHEEISNTELGAIFGYHPFYISRMLKSKKGITLHQYVISFRLKCARKLLECTDKTMAEIADETGFTDASYFTKIFKAQLGITPKEYRNRFKDMFI